MASKVKNGAEKVKRAKKKKHNERVNRLKSIYKHS